MKSEEYVDVIRTVPSMQNTGTQMDGESGDKMACRCALWQRVRTTMHDISSHLNQMAPTAHRSWATRLKTQAQQVGSDRTNPVRVKNLEKVVAHLQVLQYFLDNECLTISPGSCEILSGLLDRVRVPAEVSFENAWETADLLEAELLRLGDLSYVKGIWLTWPQHRIPEWLQNQVTKSDSELDTENQSGSLNKLIRPWLLENQRDQVQGYRRERAMIALRRSYLNVMAVTLLILDLVFCWLFIAVEAPANPNLSNSPTLGVASGVSSDKHMQIGDAAVISQTNAEAPETAASSSPVGPNTSAASWTILLLYMTVGAIGSVLARVTKLSHQPLPSEAVSSSGQDVPLGIRALMSSWSVFWAQVALGATAALIVSLIFFSQLVQIGGINSQTPGTLAVMSFIAGFSEPFLINVVGKVSGNIA